MFKKFICFIIFYSFSVNGISELSSKGKKDKVVVCYMASWAAYRPARGQFQLENLKPEHCTHLIYSFSGLNTTTSTIQSLDPWADLEENYGKGNYKKMTALKVKYPGLKVSLAIGGWNEGSQNYSILAASPKKRNNFVQSVLEFLRKYNFDGLDLDWEFPGKRGGAPYDKENFASLVKELSDSLKPNGFLLTAAISADKSTIDGAYDIPAIIDYLDFIHVMTYDYHGAWNKRVLPNSPLKCQDELCIEFTINYLIKLGAPGNKLVLGLPMYGRTFILTNKLENGESPIGMESLEKGFQGNFTREDGFMGYNEICKELVQFPKNWTTGWHEESKSAWIVNNDRVIVYDNATSFSAKVEFLKKMKLAGVMVWSIDTDDFRGDCGTIHNEILHVLIGFDYPLMKTINLALSKFSNEHEEYEMAGKPSVSHNYSEILVLFLSLSFNYIFIIFGVKNSF